MTLRVSFCWPLVAGVVAIGFVAPNASAHASRFCEKPDNAGAFLVASPGITCATAEQVKRRLISALCYAKTRCAVLGFRCVAYWEGRFTRPFEFTHHALCNSGWRWIEWDGG
jgi:hypothetical protein